MAVNIRNNAGVDLDAVFASRVSTAPGTNTGWRGPDGVDLRLRYEPYNGISPASTTGRRAFDGRDLALWFATTAISFVGGNRNINVISPFNPGSAYVVFNSNGTVSMESSTAGVSTQSWATPTTAGIGSGYQIRFYNASAMTTDQSAGAWVSLGTSKTIGVLVNTINTTRYASADYQIRNASTLAVVASGSINLNVTYGSPS